MNETNGYTIWTHEHTALELSNKVHELSNKIKKIEEINNEDGATALTKQVLIKHIIEGTDYNEPYKSFNVDEGEE